MWLFLLVSNVQGQSEVVPEKAFSVNRIEWQKSTCPDTKERRLILGLSTQHHLAPTVGSWCALCPGDKVVLRKESIRFNRFDRAGKPE